MCGVFVSGENIMKDMMKELELMREARDAMEEAGASLRRAKAIYSELRYEIEGLEIGMFHAQLSGIARKNFNKEMAFVEENFPIVEKR